MGLVATLNRELGITFIIVEHRLELLTPIADRIVVMDRGRKVMEGKPPEVLTDPQAVGLRDIRPARLEALHGPRQGRSRLSSRVPSTPEELAEEVNGR